MVRESAGSARPAGPAWGCRADFPTNRPLGLLGLLGAVRPTLFGWFRYYYCYYHYDYYNTTITITIIFTITFTQSGPADFPANRPLSPLGPPGPAGAPWGGPADFQANRPLSPLGPLGLLRLLGEVALTLQQIVR